MISVWLNETRLLHSIVGLMGTLLLLVGCAVQLVPSYDKNLVDGLTSANERTMTLFASVPAQGRASFAARENAYNEIIGKFDALRVEAAARPAQQTTFLGIGKSGSGDSRPGSATAEVLKGIVALLTRMRDDDQAGTLNAVKVAAYKGEYEIKIDQALTYENALQH
jgi:hypothetical protein